MRSSPSRSKPNKTNPSEVGKEGFIHYLFDRISPRYDLFNRLSSLGFDQFWRRQAIARLQLIPGMRILDCASGTGDLARFAAEAIVPLGFVVSCDISGSMLHFAKRKLAKTPPARWHVRMTQGRAETLPFLFGSFDAATMGFALRNVTDLRITFQELHRVLKPGGRLTLLEFGRPEGQILREGHRFWLDVAVPVLGFLTTGAIWPFLYLRQSILRFMEPADVIARLKEVGFTKVDVEFLNGGIVVLYRAVRP